MIPESFIEQFRGDEFYKNLALKKAHPDFQLDMRPLLPVDLHWNFDEAYQFVLDNVVRKLPFFAGEEVCVIS